MNDQITTVEETRRRARAAYHRGDKLDEHGPNWHTPAYVVWKKVYDELATNAQQQAGEQAQ